MPTPLTEESPRVFRPMLAAWIGLNESIFLEQLHYILTEQENVGKFADGRKWYRDTPKAFIVSYFPFWDEGTVKRTIANLRADGLILARSDLNQKPEDRSLWYTVNYSALEQLTGPVDRILNRQDKRKEARKARKAKMDSQDAYAKVQNVPLDNGKLDLPEVHFVPDDKSTKCTVDPGTKCTEGQVQNVPTPKESLPKESLPKESKDSPKGDGKPSKPKKVRLPRSFTEDSPKAELSRQMFSALADLIGYDLDMLGEKQRGQLNQAEKRMRERGWTPADVEDFREWWYANDWRGKKGQHPTLNDIRQEWKPFLDWRKEQAAKAEIFNYASDLPDPPALSPEQVIWQQVLADSPQIPKWLAAEITPIPRANGTFKLAVSNDNAKQWIDNRLMKVIKPTLNRIDDSIKEIEVIIQ